MPIFLYTVLFRAVEKTTIDGIKALDLKWWCNINTPHTSGNYRLLAQFGKWNFYFQENKTVNDCF